MLSDYRKYLAAHPDLRYLFLELTDKCNLFCRHCGSRCETGNETFLDTEMLLPYLEEIASDFEGHQFMIVVTGGEPLLHPDFDKIIIKINSLGIPWGMTTNGTLIDRKEAKKLKELMLGSVSVSLDGMRESHEWLRRIPGSFEKVLRGIDNLVAAGIKVQVTTVVGKKNIQELDSLYALMREHRVSSWRITNIDPIGRALEDNENLLNREEMIQVLNYIRKKRYDPQNDMDVCYGCAHYLPPEYEREVRNFYFFCISGLQVASITCNGDIVSCLDIERRPELLQGNARRDRFSDVWYKRFRVFREDRSEKCAECACCGERKFCHGDSAHTWDYDHNRPLICLKGEIGNG